MEFLLLPKGNIHSLMVSIFSSRVTPLRVTTTDESVAAYHKNRNHAQYNFTWLQPEQLLHCQRSRRISPWMVWFSSFVVTKIRRVPLSHTYHTEPLQFGVLLQKEHVGKHCIVQTFTMSWYGIVEFIVPSKLLYFPAYYNYT